MLVNVCCPTNYVYANLFNFSQLCKSLQFLSIMQISSISLNYANLFNFSQLCKSLQFLSIMQISSISLNYANLFNFSQLCKSLQFLTHNYRSAIINSCCSVISQRSLNECIIINKLILDNKAC